MAASKSSRRGIRSASPLSWAHVLRDVQYAIDRGDVAFAPKLRELLCWTIRIGKRRETLSDTTLVSYHARAERRLDDLLAIPPSGNAGRELQAQVKAWRGKYFLFMTDRRVPATNNVSERELRPSVVFRPLFGARSPAVSDPHGVPSCMPATGP